MTKEEVNKVSNLLSQKKISWRAFSYISGIKHSDMKTFLLGKKQDLDFWLKEINNYPSCVFYEKKYQEMMSNKKCFAFFNGDCIIFNDGSIFSKTFGIYKRVGTFSAKYKDNTYLHVSINRRNFRVQSLVAHNFVYNPNNYHFAITKDGNHTNCHYTNIEFVLTNRLYVTNPDLHKERMDSFYKETAQRYSEQQPVSEIDEAIIDYFINGTELKLYQLFFMNGFFNSQIKFMLKTVSQINDDVVIDDIYETVKRRIKNGTIKPTHKSNKGFLCYIKTEIHFRNIKRYNYIDNYQKQVNYGDY